MSHLRLILLFGVILFCRGAGRAQTDTLRHRRGDAATALSCYLLDLGDGNPASLAFLPASYVDVACENRFLLKEMMDMRARATIRYGPSRFNILFRHFGYAHYGEMSAAAGYAHSFGGKVAIAMQFHYLMTHASEYPSLHSFTFDVSLYAALTKNAHLGFSVYNPARLKYGVVGKDALPVRFHLDFDYQIGKHVLLFSAVEKELKSRFAVQVGAGYQVKVLYLSAAVQLPDPQADIGIRVAYRKLLFGAHCRYRLHLGFVPQLNIAYSF